MKERIPGFDYIRSIMSIFVVIWHFGGLGQSLIFSHNEYANHIFSLSDLINFHVLLLAVPLFIIVSNFLFFINIPTVEILKRRSKRLLVLYSFWLCAFAIFIYGIRGLENFIPDSLSSLFFNILSAWHTNYYFFISLLITTLLTYFLSSLSNRIVISCFIISCLILFLLPILTKAISSYPLSAFWNPLNFIPYAPAAILISRFRIDIEKRKYLTIFVAGLLSVIFSIIEWHIDVSDIYFQGQPSAFPSYTRVSIVFATIIVLIIALDSRIKVNRIILFMSKHALALYCLHQFFLVKDWSKYFYLTNQHYLVNQFIITVFVILSCYVLSIVLKLYFRDDVIR